MEWPPRGKVTMNVAWMTDLYCLAECDCNPGCSMAPMHEPVAPRISLTRPIIPPQVATLDHVPKSGFDVLAVSFAQREVHEDVQDAGQAVRCAPVSCGSPWIHERAFCSGIRAPGGQHRIDNGALTVCWNWFTAPPVCILDKVFASFWLLTGRNLHKNELHADWHARFRCGHVVRLVKEKNHTLNWHFNNWNATYY